jgi:diketogulonate reductase-like aldo/keto reductase
MGKMSLSHSALMRKFALAFSLAWLGLVTGYATNLEPRSTSITSTSVSVRVLPISPATQADKGSQGLAKDCPTIRLRNGMSHPAMGFGTYKVGFIPPTASAAAPGAKAPADERSAKEIFLDALKIGYRYFECAEYYGNEAIIGQAIKESGIPREELFLCSKVTTATIEKGPAAIRAALDKTLADLGTSYLDLQLVHWPVPGHHVKAYKTLQQLQLEGKIKGLGVSNYVIEDLQELLNAPGIYQVPLVNQIEINPFLYRKNTIQYCRDQGIVLQSYRSLRDGKAMDHPLLLEMARRYNKTVAQILGRWCVQLGFVYVPKSVSTHRMMENAQVFDFELRPDDMRALDCLTTDESLRTFLQLYRKCINRDTTKDGSMDGVKMDITID